MDYSLMHAAFACETGSSSAKSLLLALCSHVKCPNGLPDEYTVYPSIPRLIEMTELNKRTIAAAIEKLCQSGAITVDKHHGKSTKYTINIASITKRKIAPSRKIDTSCNFDNNQVQNCTHQLGANLHPQLGANLHHEGTIELNKEHIERTKPSLPAEKIDENLTLKIEQQVNTLYPYAQILINKSTFWKTKGYDEAEIRRRLNPVTGGSNGFRQQVLQLKEDIENGAANSTQQTSGKSTQPVNGKSRQQQRVDDYFASLPNGGRIGDMGDPNAPF